MEFETQFRGIVPDGETRRWFTWGWSPNELMIWSVLPIGYQPQGRISLDRVEVEGDGDSNTYYLTISNTGTAPVIFDAVYVAIPGNLA